MNLSNPKTFISDFRKAFSFLFGKRVVIYGIGANTSRILTEVPELDVVGLLDKEPANIGKSICGRRVIAPEDALGSDAVIIVTQTSTVWDIIYRRIKDMCAENGLPVYFTDGTRAAERSGGEDYRNDPYWDIDAKLVKRRIDGADVVSFDVFDTLIMRKTYLPVTIFYFMEKLFARRTGREIQFAAARRAAEGELRGMGRTQVSFEEIYEHLKERLGLSEEEKNYLAEKELELEERTAVPRAGVAELYEYAKRAGKEVFLVSDMYLSRRQLQRLLRRCGIGEENIFVSSEYGTKKTEGLWDVFRAAVGEGKKIVHIGDDDLGDIEEAKKRGIDAVKIFSARELLEKSSLADIAPRICSSEAELLMGLIAARIFNDPFCLAGSRGKVVWDDLEAMGYAVFALPMYSYLVWLAGNAAEKKYDSILFFARDGYFLEKLYSIIVERYGPENMPRGIYLQISRMMGCVWSIYNEEDILRVIEKNYVGKFREFMLYRFFIRADNDEHADEEIDTCADREKAVGYARPYFAEIIRTAEEQRGRYLGYFRGLDAGEFCVSDSGFLGTNQYNLSKLLNRRAEGYYFIADLDEESSPYPEQTRDMRAFFQDEDDRTAANSDFSRFHSYFESAVLVAPEGSPLGIDERGDFVRTPDGMTQKLFWCKERIFEGIAEFVGDICGCLPELGADMPTCPQDFAGAVFAKMIGSDCGIEKSVRDTFYADSHFMSTADRKMWE